MDPGSVAPKNVLACWHLHLHPDLALRPMDNRPECNCWPADSYIADIEGLNQELLHSKQSG